jgi:hypothetical protein
LNFSSCIHDGTEKLLIFSITTNNIANGIDSLQIPQK